MVTEHAHGFRILSATLLISEILAANNYYFMHAAHAIRKDRDNGKYDSAGITGETSYSSYNYVKWAYLGYQGGIIILIWVVLGCWLLAQSRENKHGVERLSRVLQLLWSWSCL